jgi:cyclic pyranopterin phosphate synthase
MNASVLNHIDHQGSLKMVDVSSKSETLRLAVARGEVWMKSNTLEAIQLGLVKKGDVLSVAQIAGIIAAKKTWDLIPLCHPLPLSRVDVEILVVPSLPGVEITTTVQACSRTGVEMEALTAVSIAALTVYDMVKAIDSTIRIQNIRLIEKHGGLSGDIVNE